MRSRGLTRTGLLVAAALAATTLGMAPQPSMASGDAQPRIQTPGLEEVVSRLDRAQHPFRILVIGDSTGVDPVGWQQLTMQWLSATTGRPWRLYSWVPEPKALTGYTAPVLFPGESAEAPLIMWNASAAGTNWHYTATHIDEMIPDGVMRIDLVLVNHGHNIRPSSQYAEVGYPLLDDLRKRFPSAAVVLFTQNPVRGDAPPNSKKAREYVRRYQETRGTPVVDVYKTFTRSGRLAELVDATDTRHPTAEGHRVWFKLLRSRLARAGVSPD